MINFLYSPLWFAPPSGRAHASGFTSPCLIDHSAACSSASNHIDVCYLVRSPLWFAPPSGRAHASGFTSWGVRFAYLFRRVFLCFYSFFPQNIVLCIGVNYGNESIKEGRAITGLFVDWSKGGLTWVFRKINGCFIKHGYKQR